MKLIERWRRKVRTKQVRDELGKELDMSGERSMVSNEKVEEDGAKG